MGSTQARSPSSPVLVCFREFLLRLSGLARERKRVTLVESRPVNGFTGRPLSSGQNRRHFNVAEDFGEPSGVSF